VKRCPLRRVQGGGRVFVGHSLLFYHLRRRHHHHHQQQQQQQQRSALFSEPLNPHRGNDVDFVMTSSSTTPDALSGVTDDAAERGVWNEVQDEIEGEIQLYTPTANNINLLTAGCQMSFYTSLHEFMSRGRYNTQKYFIVTRVAS